MKGDFSKWSFDPADNFTGVLEQQGRVRMDQDGNAATQIVNHLRTTLVRDAIGAGVAGVPESMPHSFKVTRASTDGRIVKVALKPGRVWADGIPLVAPGSADLNMLADYIGPPITRTTHTAASITAGTRDAVVLEVWEEAVNAFQDPDLMESALGGVDTSERIKVFYSLRLLRLDTTQDCDDVTDRLAEELPKGRLTAKPADENIINDECPVVAGGGYSGFEHCLYRIEIAEPDAGSNARFKWSSFNGGLAGKGKYTPTPGDATKGRLEVCANDQMIRHCGLSKFYFESLDYDSSRGRWTAAMTADATLSADGNLSLTNVDQMGTMGPEPVFFRLWDGIEKIKYFVSSKELSNGDGILLEFDAPATDNTNYLPGDYWTFPVRAAGVPFDWSALPANARPQGVRYHRVPLAILNWTGPTATLTAPASIQDYREEFPQLVNVRKGCCLDVAPDEDLQTAVCKVKEAGGGCICLLPGEHTLTRSIDLSGESGICIKGFGVVSRLKISPTVRTAAFILKNAHHIGFDGFAILSDGDVPVWFCDQTTDLTLANLFTFAQLKGGQTAIVAGEGAGSRWQVENCIFIAPSGLSGHTVYQSTFRHNYWLGTHAGMDLKNLMDVALEYNYFLGTSDADLKKYLALSSETDLKKALTRQNFFQSLLHLFAQQSTASISTRYNAVDLSGGFDLTITGNRMMGRLGLGCEILENAKITNNDFLTTVFGVSCGIVRNLIFSENRMGVYIPNKREAGVICKVGLRVIADVSDCRVLYNSFDNVEEGIVFESDFDGGKETVRAYGGKMYVGSFDDDFNLTKAFEDSKKLTERSKDKWRLLTSSYFIMAKCERIRIEGNHFRAGKLAIAWSGIKEVVDFRIVDNAINGCQQPAIQIEPDDSIQLITERIDTKVRLIEKNRFDIFGAAVRSTLGGVQIEHNDIRIRKPKKSGVKDAVITKFMAEHLYRHPGLVEANAKLDHSGSRMIAKEAMSEAKMNPDAIDKLAFIKIVNEDVLNVNKPHKWDLYADELNKMAGLATVGAMTPLLDTALNVFWAANVNQEGFAVNLGGTQNRVNGNWLYSDNPEIESGVLFNLQSGEARENNILVQRIAVMMNAKAGQASQDVRIVGNTLRVVGKQSSGGASEVAYALSIPTLKPGNLTILDNYFEGSVMVGAEPFASLGLKSSTDVKHYIGHVICNAMKFDSGTLPAAVFNKSQPKKSKSTEVKKDVVIGLVPVMFAADFYWDDDPHENRPVVQFRDNRVARGWVAIAQSFAGAFWTPETLKNKAKKAMLLTLTGNTFDYWARVCGHDLILTGNNSQTAIQYRYGRTLKQFANIPEPMTF